MKVFLKAIDRTNELVGKAISFLMLPLIAVIVYEIFVRYVLNSPTIWAFDVSQMIYGVYVILAGGFLQQRNGHVNVDILHNRFKPRTKAIIDLFTWIFFFFFAGVILVKGWILAHDSFVYRETASTVFDPPIYPIKMMIPLGGLLLILQGLAKYIRAIMTVVTGKEEEAAK
jgi:TRAP-type mannitol/chloroaromatic compound transport system permease small subunit